MYNSDGYILIDLTGVDITKSNQYLKGIYNRIVSVIDTNKLALVINAGDLTPMASIVRKSFNYYVITTNLYIFTINTNDIIVIQEAGESTVDVSIVPSLLEGVKIADFAIGATEGSIYAPEQQSEINDSVTGNNTTWSSDKISTDLATKANIASLSTVATTGDYDDLLDKPSIPSKTSDLVNDSGFITSAQVPTIDDNTVASDKVWSSYKTSAEIGTKANSTDVYTKTEVDTALGAKQNSTDNSLTTTNKNVVGAINEINTNLSNSTSYSLTEKSIGDFFGTTLYRQGFVLTNITVPKNGNYIKAISDLISGNIRIIDYKAIARVGTQYLILPYTYSNTGSNVYSTDIAVDNANFMITRGNSNDLTINDLTIIFDYIKVV